MEAILDLLPHLASFLTLGIMWQVWRMVSAMEKTAASAKTAAAAASENQRNITVLLEDHKEIKRQQEELMDFCRKLYGQHNAQDIELTKMAKDLECMQHEIREIKVKLEKTK